jgi:hypothetical protein
MEHAKVLTALKVLRLPEPQTTADGAEKLQLALPNSWIDRYGRR